jgi:hypothetical protein
MQSARGYKLVQLASGVHSVHSVAQGETFHPVIGPTAEAEALYVQQLALPDRIRRQTGEFVLWDVGLGAAANPLTVLRAVRGFPARLRILSFDHTGEPLRFALEHSVVLGYLAGYEGQLRALLDQRRAHFVDGAATVDWSFHEGDFPTLLARPEVGELPKPHAILYDAYSPATNPEMWTQPVFASLFRLLDPRRPCALPTYSRSTLLRVTLLLAGFFVGVGHATGEKEETTLAANNRGLILAANDRGLIREPLDRRWLLRARRSTSAEPLGEPIYRQARMSPATWERLQLHPQFSHAGC